MIHLRATLFLCLLLLCPSAFAAELQLVTEPWPPYSMLRHGKLAGLNYATTVEVMRLLGHTVHSRVLPWKRAMEEVHQKRADLLLDATKNSLRSARYYFPKEPLVAIDIAVFSLKGRTFEYTGLHSLGGLNVGIMAGYSYSEAFNSATHFHKEEVNSLRSGFQKLLSGRVDVLVEQRLAGMYELVVNGWQDQIHVSRMLLSKGEPLYLAFARTPEMHRLSKEFSTALKEFKTTPRYRQLLVQYGEHFPDSSRTE